MADSSDSVSIDMETISLGGKVTRISIYHLVWLPGKCGIGSEKEMEKMLSLLNLNEPICLFFC